MAEDEVRGFESVEEVLDAEDFPMDAEAVAYSVGDVEIEDGQGGWVPVRVALDHVTQERFATAADVLHALREALKRRR